MNTQHPKPCAEQQNHVCNFSDCPCQRTKYRTFGEEMIRGRFANEVRSHMIDQTKEYDSIVFMVER